MGYDADTWLQDETSVLGVVDSLSDRLELLEDNITNFEDVLSSIRESKSLVKLLSLVLSFGNFLNGGNARLGQADGFHIEVLAGRYSAGLNSVKDPDGKEIRHLIFDTFMKRYPEEAAILFEELRPLFSNIQRAFGKPKAEEGGDVDQFAAETIQKTARLKMETLEDQISQLQTQFKSRNEDFRNLVVLIDDPADVFRLRMPALFREASDSFADLQNHYSKVKDVFQEILTWFHASKFLFSSRDTTEQRDMTSGEFCLIWDDFILPPQQFNKFDTKTRKANLVPAFCKSAPVSLDNMLMLWEMNTPKKKDAPATSKKTMRKKSVMRRKSARASVAARKSLSQAKDDASAMIMTRTNQDSFPAQRVQGAPQESDSRRLHDKKLPALERTNSPLSNLAHEMGAVQRPQVDGEVGESAEDMKERFMRQLRKPAQNNEDKKCRFASGVPGADEF